MQSASSRIWTRVAVSISYNDNQYTTGTIFSMLYLVWYTGLNLYILCTVSKWLPI